MTITPPAVRRVAAGLVALGLSATFELNAQSDLVSLSLRADALVTPWVDAARRHRPGEVDSALMVPASWNRIELQQAWVYLQVLAVMLHDVDVDRGGIVVAQDGITRRPRMAESDLESLRGTAREILDAGSANDFLARAALLHTDVTTMLDLGASGSAHDVSLLTAKRLMVETDDGRQRGLRQGAVHWEFARVLLDRMERPSQNPIVRNWYRATMRYKLGIADFDTPHFTHALSLFPNDADIRFLVGALHAAFADSTIQATRGSLRLPPGARLAIAGIDGELANAEGQLRRSLAIDPSHAEARLRLGWTLYRRGDAKEAAAHLQRVADDTSDIVLRYYAYLFLGLAMESLSRFGEAQAAFDQALTLFPRAQAPRVAASQIAHRLGDRVAAESALRPVMMPRETKDEADDPWWRYLTSAGRRGQADLEAVRQSVSRLAS